MPNPAVIEWEYPEAENQCRLDTHSTTSPNFSKYSFRDVSRALTADHDRRILEVYKYISEHGGHNLTTQYERCRTHAWLVQNEETRELRVASRKCNQRWCPMCQKTKRWIITNSVSEWVQQRKYVKFITVTLKSSNESLCFQVKRLYESFKILRRKKLWKQSVRGGVWFFQLTMNDTTKQWHPHVHVLADSDYISKKNLALLWMEITHDSYIVDVRAVEDPEKAAEYVARYATVPGDILKCSVAQGSAMVIGLKGQRMCGAFGTAKGMALRPRASADNVQWRKVMSYSTLVVGSAIDETIEQMAEYLRTGEPYPFEIWGLYDTPEMPPIVTRFKPESMRQLLFEFDNCFYLTGVC